MPIHPRCPSLSHSLDWTGLDWTGGASGVSRLTLGTVASTLSPSSLLASRFSLVVGRVFFLVVASRWLVVHGQRSAEAHGFLSFTPLFPRARPPPPTSPASHLSSPPFQAHLPYPSHLRSP